MKRGRAFLVEQAKQAAALGHTVELETRDRSAEFPDEGQAAVKWWAVCSCGYRSRPARTQGVALGWGFHHLGGVASAGVSLPPVAGSAP